MLNAVNLFFHCGNPGIIRHAKGGDSDSGAHVDIFLSGSILYK
jgi:hypothetical protein